MLCFARACVTDWREVMSFGPSCIRLYAGMFKEEMWWIMGMFANFALVSQIWSHHTCTTPIKLISWFKLLMDDNQGYLFPM